MVTNPAQSCGPTDSASLKTEIGKLFMLSNIDLDGQMIDWMDGWTDRLYGSIKSKDSC